MTAALSPAGVLVDRRVMRLAALFVQADGCYAGRDDIDAWPEHHSEHMMGEMLTMAIELTKTEVLK